MGSGLLARWLSIQKLRHLACKALGPSTAWLSMLKLVLIKSGDPKPKKNETVTNAWSLKQLKQ